MEFSNPEIPEGINTTNEHSLKEFAILTGGIIGCVIIIVLILAFLAEFLAPYIPFSMERELAAKFIEKSEIESDTQRYLQTLTDNISQQMDLPDDAQITLHYVDDDIENAFAS